MGSWYGLTIATVKKTTPVPLSDPPSPYRMHTGSGPHRLRRPFRLTDFALRPLGEYVLHRRLHLVGREVLNVRRERPFVAVRIGHDSVAVTPEHVPCRH